MRAILGALVLLILATSWWDQNFNNGAYSGVVEVALVSFKNRIWN